MSAPLDSRTPATTSHRLVLVTQYYVPDVAATGQILHGLAADLARRGFEVQAITVQPGYAGKELAAPSRERLQGVSVRRVRATRFNKNRLPGRMINIATFLLQVTRHTLFGPVDCLYLYVTNPPFLPIVGALVSLIRPHRYVILLHDAYPQVAVWVGTIKAGGWLERAWNQLNRVAYRRAARTIVLCKKAKELVASTYGVRSERIHEIPNWADGDVIEPRPKSRSAFAKRHQLLDDFALLYSGNLGLFHDFETILGVAQRLLGERFRLVLVGDGGRAGWLGRQITHRRLTNTLLLPYQPQADLPDSLTGCDAALVGIAEGIEGISFPSKLYTFLAAGKPILALCEPDSQLRRIVEEGNAGWWAPVGDVDRATETVLEMLHSDPSRLAARGENARRLYERKYTLAHSAAAYAALLSTTLEGRGPSTRRAAPTTDPGPTPRSGG